MEPRFENGRELSLAGIGERYNMSNGDRIPAQWDRFDPWIGGRVAYGVITLIGAGGDFDYLCGVEAFLPEGFERLRIAANTYAVFTHVGHISTIRNTFQKIFMEWLPKSGRKFSRAPRFERYRDDFDKNTGRGAVEIWIPTRVTSGQSGSGHGFAAGPVSDKVRGSAIGTSFKYVLRVIHPGKEVLLAFGKQFELRQHHGLCYALYEEAVRRRG